MTITVTFGHPGGVHTGCVVRSLKLREADEETGIEVTADGPNGPVTFYLPRELMTDAAKLLVSVSPEPIVYRTEPARSLAEVLCTEHGW